MSYAVDEVHPQVDFLRASDNAEVVHSEAGPVVTVRLDPTGRRGCITNPAQQLTCIELAARKRIAVSEGPVYAPFLEFDDTGRSVSSPSNRMILRPPAGSEVAQNLRLATISMRVSWFGTTAK
jgi:hypothetical protein